MTKKHYIEIASILKNERTFGEFPPVVDALAKEFAAFFKRENPAFKRDVFLKAAGVES